MAIVVTCRVCGKVFTAYPRTTRGGANLRYSTECSVPCSNAYKHSPAGIAERFWSYVDRSGGPDACWPWTGGLVGKGYGKFSYGGRTAQVHVRANRFALETKVGPIGDLYACHACDNPPCCNPAHLFPGTNADNQTDYFAKSRFRETGHSTVIKLDEDAVRAIRAEVANGVPVADLAERFNVCHRSVTDVVDGVRWAWVKS